MELNDIIHIITDIESKYPIEKLKYKNFNYWPVIRGIIHRDVYINIIDKDNTRNVGSKAEEIKKKNALFSSAFSFFKATLNFFKRNKIIIFGIYGHRSEFINERYFNRVSDSLKLELDNQYKVIQVELFSDTIRSKKTFFPVYDFDFFLQFVSGFIEKKKRTDSTLTKEVDSFLAYIAIHYSYIKLSKGELIKTIKEIHIQHYAYRILFFLLRPKFILFDIYYFKNAYAAILAGKKMKIRTIDVQHGIVNDYHIAYASFPVKKITNYDLLPNEFWVWDDYAFKTINQWAAMSQQHRAIVKGNIFFSQILKGSITLPQIPVDYMQTIRSKKTCVLITLNNLPDADKAILQKKIFPSINNTKLTDICWIFRMHPQHEASIENWLALNKIKNDHHVIIHKSKEINLYELFKHTHIHITFESTVAIEANSMNIPSLILNQNGADFFKEHLQSGVFTFINSNEELTHYLDTLLSKNNSSFSQK